MVITLKEETVTQELIDNGKYYSHYLGKTFYYKRMYGGTPSAYWEKISKEKYLSFYEENVHQINVLEKTDTMKKETVFFYYK